MITPDGTRYNFGKDPNSTDEGQYDINYNVQTGNSRTVWHLVKMETSDKKSWIKFAYANESYEYTMKTSKTSFIKISTLPGQYSVNSGMQQGGNIYSELDNSGRKDYLNYMTYPLTFR